MQKRKVSCYGYKKHSAHFKKIKKSVQACKKIRSYIFASVQKNQSGYPQKIQKNYPNFFSGNKKQLLTPVFLRLAYNSLKRNSHKI